MNNIYYVYVYISKRTNLPYYVGKGKGRRFKHPSHTVPVPKENERILFLENNMSNELACELEKKLIKIFGRRDLGTGILLNLTNGGDGRNGPQSEEEKQRKRGPLTDEEKELRYISRRGPRGPYSEERKQKLRGPRPHTRGPRGPLTEEERLLKYESRRGPRGPHKNPMTPEQKKESKRKMWETRRLNDIH